MGGLGNPRFRLLTGRPAPDLEARLATGRDALAVLDAHLAGAVVRRRASARRSPTRAVPVRQRRRRRGRRSRRPEVGAWLDRVRALPGFVDDFVTYPANARPGAGRSIYERPRA